MSSKQSNSLTRCLDLSPFAVCISLEGYKDCLTAEPDSIVTGGRHSRGPEDSVIPISRVSPSMNQTHFFPFASSAALILSLAARLPPNFGPDATVPAAAEPALALALTAGFLRERFRASACARKSALNAAAAAASGSWSMLLVATAGFGGV